MSTFSTPETPASAPNRIVKVIYRSLESALVSLCRRRYDAELTLRRLEAEEDAALHLQVECGGLGRLRARFTIRPVGAADYEVRCAVEDETVRRFTYSRSRREDTALSHAPCLGRTLASFLLDELERRVGRRVLRRTAGSAQGNSGGDGSPSSLPSGLSL